MIPITLPKASEFHPLHNYAENLRSASVAGEEICVPAGTPRTILANVGRLPVCLPGGDILSVSDDYHEVMLNGQWAGSLSSAMLTALPLGRGQAVIFTSAGPEWFAEGRVQGAAPADAPVQLTAVSSGAPLAAEVIAPALKGDYNRATAPLQQADADSFALAVASTFEQLRLRAAAMGRWVQPARVTWRMVDADGRVLCAGEPIAVGSLQGDDPLSFPAERTDSGSLAVSRSATLSVTPYSLHLSVGQSISPFWRERVAAIEIVAWCNLAEMVGVSGAFTQTSSAQSVLSLTPVLRAVDPSEVAPCIVARIENPLNGVDLTIDLQNQDPTQWVAADSAQAFTASAAYSAGTLIAYALPSRPGVLAVASSANPLIPLASKPVCNGRIVRICSPAGGAGGWNYGRQHLLVFATDGIFSVSVDAAMKNITSSPVYHTGIDRTDAVAVAPDAIYVATAPGDLMRLCGARITRFMWPDRVAMLCWNSAHSELLTATAAGSVAVLTQQGRAYVRTDLTVTRFLDPALAVTADSSLCNLADEVPVSIHVAWKRRLTEPCHFRKPQRMVNWRIDAELATDLHLTLLADSGGTPQPLLNLTVNGPVNAPIRASLLSPPRAYLTASLSGSLLPPARLHSITLTPS